MLALLLFAAAGAGREPAFEVDLAQAVDLDLGPEVGCVVTAASQVACFTLASRGTEIHVLAESAGAELVAVGKQGVCAKHREGGISCWKLTVSPWIAEGPYQRDALPVVDSCDAAEHECRESVLAAITDIDRGGCRLEHGRVDCAGHAGPERSAEAPWAMVPQIEDAAGLAVATTHACLLRRHGGVVCWGEAPGVRVATGVRALLVDEPARQLAVAPGRTCIATDSGAECFAGEHEHVEAGPLRDIAVSATAFCAILADGRLRCRAEPSKPARPEPPDTKPPEATPALPFALTYANRISVGGGRRARPTRAEEKLFEMGASFDLLAGPRDKDVQPWALGPMLDVRTRDFDGWQLAAALEGVVTQKDGGALGLAMGGGWSLVETRGFFTLVQARAGLRANVADRGDTLLYAFEMAMYVSVRVGLGRPRLVEVTGGFDFDPVALAALVTLPFED